MRYSLKIAVFCMKPGSQEEMYYTDDKGELFIGSVKVSLLAKLIGLKPIPSALAAPIIE